ncbi:thymidine kinase [Streptomyces sp. SL13]|uniref:Thymidine kinase n=1 Tax=Streptantibioticus silvisoli TaxID=2705255 RepID=A0AA90HDD2_9ACTN|nr:thymidine kinase [Streptantibioticus silvisoli]MDI5965937.1 thymidine kinase [Streptantibioticus silvisoli]MDI5974312.1 thymidine kinase [Streptantibioticus silvisoli]
MSELVFFCGTMDCGKSTLALQIEHNRSARGKRGLIFTRDDRAGAGVLSSRLGLCTQAVEAPEAFDFYAHVTDHLACGRPADYVIADEAQFFTAGQIEQLARVVDDLDLDVYAFGITTDFRTRLFPGSQRLVELADRIEVLQVEALCWCGARATHNARTVDGHMVVEGAQVVVGDVNGTGGETGYEVLCRRHHLRRQTALNAEAGARADSAADVMTARERTGTHADAR